MPCTLWEGEKRTGLWGPSITNSPLVTHNRPHVDPYVFLLLILYKHIKMYNATCYNRT